MFLNTFPDEAVTTSGITIKTFLILLDFNVQLLYKFGSVFNKEWVHNLLSWKSERFILIAVLLGSARRSIMAYIDSSYVTQNDVTNDFVTRLIRPSSSAHYSMVHPATNISQQPRRQDR